MKGRITVCVFCSLPFGLLSFFVLSQLNISPAFSLSVACAVFFLLFLFHTLGIISRNQEQKYAEFEATLSVPFFYKTNGNFHFENGKVRNGNIYLCEDGILFVSMDKKVPGVDVIFLNELENVKYTDVALLIRKQDGKEYSITSAHVQDLVEQLYKADWITRDNA